MTRLILSAQLLALAAGCATTSRLRDGGQQPGDCTICVIRHERCVTKCDNKLTDDLVECLKYDPPYRQICETNAHWAHDLCCEICRLESLLCWTYLGCPVAAWEVE